MVLIESSNMEIAMQRTIFALWGLANAGKTTTIRLAYEKLAREENVIDPGRRSKKEVRGAILKIDGIKIGFASQGDRADVLRENIERLIAAGCIIIVCAAHTPRSLTYKVVEQFINEFEIVFIEKVADPDRKDAANLEKSDEIIRRIKSILKS